MKAKILVSGNTPTEVEFTSIKSEIWRSYEFPSGYIVNIQKPQWLYVNKSGSHRLVDGEGISHYIPTGWLHLYWEVKEGEPYFIR